MSNESIVRVPVVATRGIILFPGLDSMIEVGRTKSINAVNTSSQSFDSMVWVVCQNDIMVDDPKEENLYRIYTLSSLGYDPYVMVYDKPHAPKEIKRLQRWCNNKIIFKKVPRFEDYSSRKG